MRARVVMVLAVCGAVAMAGPAMGGGPSGSHGGGHSGGGHSSSGNHVGSGSHGGGHGGGTVGRGGPSAHTPRGTLHGGGGGVGGWGRHGGWRHHGSWGGRFGWGFPFWWGGVLGWGWPFAYYGAWGPWWDDGGWAYGPTAAGGAGYELTAVDTDVSPENALVYLNGTLIGIADDFDGNPDYLYLKPGHYRLDFRLPGYVAQGIDVDAGAAERVPVDIQLERDRSGRPVEAYQPPQGTPYGRVFGPEFGSAAGRVGSGPDPSLRPELRRPLAQPPASPPPGSASGGSADLAALRVRATPDNAAVYLDGAFIGSAAELARMRRGIAVTAGRHRVEVMAPGHASKSVDVALAAGEDQSVGVDLD